MTPMPIDIRNARSLLKQLDLRRLFIEELNWANPARRTQSIETGSGKFTLKPLAEQGGMVVFEVENKSGEGIPDRSTRLAVHSKLLEHAQEHILVFVNRPRTATCWLWVDREGGKRVRSPEHRYHTSQPGDSLLQKLQGLAFQWDELDNEGKASIVQVTDRVRANLATDRVTKRFYDEFQRQHAGFLDFIDGIEKLDDRRWYASVMLNRLMFIYFIQRKGFLDGDPAYLRNRLRHCQASGIPYYRGFLVPLFFEGFATKPDERSQEATALLGDIPYLNGGLFMPHQIEQAAGVARGEGVMNAAPTGPTMGDDAPDTGSCAVGAAFMTPSPAHDIGIDIPDDAFVRMFDFFDRYQWHLDDRPLRADNEINPDVLGYIFEKYINQKQMGAYYTKEDITGYITRNTVLPFLFDKLGSFMPDAVRPLPVGDVNRYIFDAMRKGVDLPLPDHIAVGLDSVPQRTQWNKAADPEFALPTETWREHIARRRRVEEIRDHFGGAERAVCAKSGPVPPAGPAGHTISDFITYNLDIVRFAQDFLADTDDPQVIRRFYFQCLQPLTVLDPTCGSGAFLFAALNILEPLYELCLQRMEEFLGRRQREKEWAQPFEMELERLKQHPSRRYFVYKSIIVNNLFGVDIMDEAVEICKLRLFLKLVAQVEDVAHIEPLPDIDFNIRAGNTLVGYASLQEIEKAKAGKLDFGGIVDRVKAADRLIKTFRDLQMSTGVSAQHLRESKDNLRADLRELEAELNRDLAFEYGAQDLSAFVASHKPFHWYVEFYDTIQHGGFDIVIGNPPWAEYSTVRAQYQVRGYVTEPCGNLLALASERSLSLLRPQGRFGFIVQVPVMSSRRTQTLRDELLRRCSQLWVPSFDDRPGKLFEGLQHCRSAIIIASRADAGTTPSSVHATHYNRWHSEDRALLFPSLQYARPELAPLWQAIPKLGDDQAKAAWRRFVAGRNRHDLGSILPATGDGSVFYQEATQYWVKATQRVPHYAKNGTVGVPPHGRYIECDGTPQAASLAAVMNSTLFYLWFVCASDCYHVSDALVRSFPCPEDLLVDPRLSRLGRALEARLHKQATLTTITTKSGEQIAYAAFDCAASKPIIDDIDRVLAEHYGFTEDELDFIINYDIKYRMGGAEEN